VKACIWNTNPNDEFVINPHDRICQMMFLPVIHPEFEIVEELGVSDRGEGGFGSSGVSAH
jgi:dUTP pyrophosphatase